MMVDCKICGHPYCEHAGTQRGIVIDCANYMPRQKPMTNADRIRAMSDEALAEWMSGMAYGRETPWSEPFQKKFCDNCPTVRGTYESGREDDFNECDFSDGVCPHGSDIVWWLRQPAGVGE